MSFLTRYWRRHIGGQIPADAPDPGQRPQVGASFLVGQVLRLLRHFSTEALARVRVLRRKCLAAVSALFSEGFSLTVERPASPRRSRYPGLTFLCLGPLDKPPCNGQRQAPRFVLMAGALHRDVFARLRRQRLPMAMPSTRKPAPASAPQIRFGIAGTYLIIPNPLKGYHDFISRGITLSPHAYW